MKPEQLLGFEHGQLGVDGILALGALEGGFETVGVAGAQCARAKNSASARLSRGFASTRLAKSARASSVPSMNFCRAASSRVRGASGRTQNAA